MIRVIRKVTSNGTFDAFYKIFALIFLVLNFWYLTVIAPNAKRYKELNDRVTRIENCAYELRVTNLENCVTTLQENNSTITIQLAEIRALLQSR